MPWRWPCGGVATMSTASSTTVIAACNTSPSATPSASAEAGAVTSVGSRGDAYDNALAETINGLYKTELIRKRGPWKTLEDVEFATLEWVDWFNNRRLLEPIGYIPPAEFEEMFYREQVLVEDEGLKQMSLH